MPPWMPRSSRSSPSCSWRRSSRASSSETSVKTAIKPPTARPWEACAPTGGSAVAQPQTWGPTSLKFEDVPDPLAAGAGHAVAVVGRAAAPQVGRLEFVLRHVGLGLHGDALGLAADTQFVDPGAVVL